jgi:hypothetical protein
MTGATGMTGQTETTARAICTGRFLLVAAGGVTLWLLAVFLARFTFGSGRTVEHVLFLDQDFPALLIAIVGLILVALLSARASARLPDPSLRLVGPLVLLCALWSWLGHYAVFQDYALSRDEESAEFAAAYLRDGLLARPIPAEWVEFRRAIMPEFFSPYGAASHWASAYLPVNSAIRALFWHLGDPNLAGPVLLAIGLFSLWRVALRLFPDRPDAVWVTMLLAFTSAQLSVTAMTPYAMTGHFAFNMLWLALVLRDDKAGHLGAAIVAILAAGLHQYHFPPIFIGPFLLWMALRRRWGTFAFHALVVLLLVGLWAKLWPTLLLHQFGPAADVRPSAGVGDKVGSLFRRLSGKWEPLFNLSRLLAWNNILMVPLAVLGMAAMRWRDALRGQSLVLPLGIGCVLTCLLALHQGYGWGFRYAHGFIGAFCLLAGYGWVRLSGREGRGVPLAVLLLPAVFVLAFLTVRASLYVAPYAAGHRLIHATDADVVLVDPRGGIYATDLVRTQHGDAARPVVMSLLMLTPAMTDTLCARHDVAIFDYNAFRRLGVRPARWRTGYLDLLRNRMAAHGCGRIILP